MQLDLEISFHNLYHFYKEKYQDQDQNNNNNEISPSHNIKNNIILSPHNDKIHYDNIEVSNEPDIVGKDDSSFIIEDLNNEIVSIITNNPRCIKISTKINKRLFKKYKIYTIVHTRKGNGVIKITYNNGNPIETRSFYGIQNDNSSKLGSLSGDDPDFWVKDDPFISNKYIDCLYSYSSLKHDIEKHINICYNIGAECTFVCNYFDYNCISDQKYVSKYISDFTEYIEYISNTKPDNIPCTIIYEPELLTYVYNSGNTNPNNILIKTNENNTISLVQFIFNMKSICHSYSIHFVNAFTPFIHTLLQKVIDTEDFDGYLNVIKNKATHIANYLSYFNSINTKYLAFKVNHSRKLYSNDENLAYLFFIKCILENLKLKGILFDIPVGHVNGVKSVSLYTNNKFVNHTDKPGDYQDSSSLFLFGGSVIMYDVKYRQNKFKDTGISINGFTIYSKEHISLCNTFNIKYIMFGPTNLKDTTNVPLKSRGNKCTDQYYTMCKINEYYRQK